MPRFFRRFADGIFDVEDLKYRTNQLAGFIKMASSHYGFASNSIVGVGYSNGANIGTSLLFLHPGVLREAVLFRPMVPLVPEKQPDLAGNPVYVSAGVKDPIVARNETERLVKILREYGADVTLSWVNTGHALAGPEVQDAKVWFDQEFA